MNKPQLFVLVGGNGAGKSTFFQQFLKAKDLPFVNADLIAKEFYHDNAEARSYDAAMLAAQQRKILLTQKQSFCFETVFSHPSKVDFLADAIAMGYEVLLIGIFLDSIELNAARVCHRVACGGHTVPENKILRRIPRTIENIKLAIPLVSETWLIDNSSITKPFKHTLRFKQGRLVYRSEDLPDWTNSFIALN